uniref:Transmembrane protein 249 n=1 Tax=Steinernema glaseri TaxID=37863 RepID=A0A1I7Y658_9BILA
MTPQTMSSSLLFYYRLLNMEFRLLEGVANRETLGIFLRQRVGNPRSHTEMVLQGGLLLAMVVFYVYYQSAMNSKLTAPSKPAVPFRTQSQLFDLMDQRKAHVFYPVNVSMECSNRENCNRMPGVFRRNPLHLVQDDEAEWRREMDAGGVYMATHDIDLLPFDVSWYDRKERTILIKDPNGLHFYMGFAFSLRNALHRNVFNRALIKVLPGIPRIMLGPGYHSTKRNYFTAIKARKETLTFQYHLVQLFLSFLIGSSVSVALFVLELLVYRSKIQRRLAENYERRISGVYFGGFKRLSWFPGYGRDGRMAEDQRYRNVENF